MYCTLRRLLIFAWAACTLSVAIDLEEIKCERLATLAPPQKVLRDVRTSSVRLPGTPHGLTFLDGHNDVAFVTLDDDGVYLGVLEMRASIPTYSRRVALLGEQHGRVGTLVLSRMPGRRIALMAYGTGAIVIDFFAAMRGWDHPIIGTLNGTTSDENPGKEAAAVEASPDGRYIYVSQEWGDHGNLRGVMSGNVDVFRIDDALDARRLMSGSPVGFLELDLAVNGIAISPDGNTLYATSEQIAPGIFSGSLSVVDTGTLQTNPSMALLARIRVGCGAVRAIASIDGKTVWVTSREDNRLMAFDSAKLRLGDVEALPLVNITVGTSPIGLVFARNGTRILTADSNRFNLPNGRSGVSVVDVEAAMAGKGHESVLGFIETGLFPREFAVSPDGRTILVTNVFSSEIQAIDVASVP